MQSLSRSSILEAVLFAAGAPLPLSKLAEIIEVPEWEVQEALTVLERRHAEYFCVDRQAAISS